MKNPPIGAALAGLGLLLVNGAIIPDAASAAVMTVESPVAPTAALAEATLANAHVLDVQGQRSSVSDEQIDAYSSLSAALQNKLGSPDESRQIAMRPRSTIMCPW